jgi:hypothetical protein
MLWIDPSAPTRVDIMKLLMDSCNSLVIESR